MKTCPLCKSGPIKVIYYGLPVLLCENENCSCMFGFWSYVTDMFPFTGVMMGYEGSYWPALWHWLFGGE